MKTTLAELRMEVLEHLKPGMPFMRCRVCHRLVKLYRRTIDGRICRVLLKLYIEDAKRPGRWVYYRNVIQVSAISDVQLLRWWGLVESKPVPRGKRETGDWRITERGRAFVRQRITLPKYVYLYNDRRRGFSPNRMTVAEAYDEPFDLDDIMHYGPTPWIPVRQRPKKTRRGKGRP